MILSDPRVAKVFEAYKVREVMDRERMAQLGRGGFASRDEFLLPVGEDVGGFLHALVLARRPRTILELGTSYGYSTLLLADAARSVGARVITMDLAEYKQDYARARLEEAGLDGFVDFRCGDAITLLASEPGPFDFVLLDIWKDLYRPCLAAFAPKLADEAIVAADNIISPDFDRMEMRAYRATIAALPNMTSTLLPIGQGIELSVRWNPSNPKL
jgi:predicted O-methyltransferase YrrM